MTDREMLELAAKAAGYDVSHPVNAERLLLDRPVSSLWVRDDGGLCKTAWNPLLDNADAFALAVKLGINLEIGEPGFGDVQAGRRDHWACEWLNPDDPCASVRLAITRAAAEIGRAMG